MQTASGGWTVVKSPIGDLIVIATPFGIARIAWDISDPDGFVQAEVQRLQVGPLVRAQSPVLDRCRSQLASWFAGELDAFDLPLSPDPSAPNTFASRVLRATARIPRGSTRTYGEVARVAGNPAGARAAGNALGSNPIPIVIPCHRVVAASGLGGFSGGSNRKRVLLGIEGAPIAA